MAKITATQKIEQYMTGRVRFVNAALVAEKTQLSVSSAKRVLAWLTQQDKLERVKDPDGKGNKYRWIAQSGEAIAQPTPPATTKKALTTKQDKPPTAPPLPTTVEQALATYQAEEALVLAALQERTAALQQMRKNLGSWSLSSDKKADPG